MPNLVEIVSGHLGITPKQKGTTFHFPCPACHEGCDRFIVWPASTVKPSGTFYCRQCRLAGDGISFCKDFLGLTYPQACELLMVEKKECHYPNSCVSYSAPSFPVIKHPVFQWQEQAKAYLDFCKKELRIRKEAQLLIQKRGITAETADGFILGYNPSTSWENMESWGLPKQIKENGRERKLWFPKGLVIPRFDPFSKVVVGIKIRREEWEKGDDLPKYVEVIGSTNTIGIFGNTALKVAVIMEAELDAIILQQQAGDQCFSLALGGAGTKRMDYSTFNLLNSCPLVLLATDYDKAGIHELNWWKDNLPKAKYWPSPCGKSPGEAHELGADLHIWIRCAIRKYQLNEVLNV